MGNNAPCMTIGIGSIQIEMHDGFVRTLARVHHVPALKKKLIPVGALDSKGFMCSVESGVIQIRQGNVVVMRGIRKSNLYFLQGITITRSVSLFFSC